MSAVAFRSDAPKVLAAWNTFQSDAAEMSARRNAVAERFGRRLMVSRGGFGHGTRVVGFEEFEGDVPGSMLGDNAELRVPKKGPPYSTVVPNLRRKAGRDLADELRTLSTTGPDLPGMPSFQLVGLHSLAPALFEHDGAIWAYWSDDITDVRTGGVVDLTAWEPRPLSAYFAAKEAHGAAEVTS